MGEAEVIISTGSRVKKNMYLQHLTTSNMKKIILSITCLLGIYAAAFSQYVAIRSGISLNEYGSSDSRSLVTIPYGTKLENYSTDSYGGMTSSGLTGNWRKLTYGEKTGFFFDGYLLPIPPPESPAQTLEQYIEKNYQKVAGPVEWASTDEKSGAFGQYKQTIYDNGVYIVSYTDKVSISTSFFITGLTLRQAFHFCKLFSTLGELIGEKSEFPLTDVDTDTRKVKNILNPESGKNESDGVYISNETARMAFLIRENNNRIEIKVTQLIGK